MISPNLNNKKIEFEVALAKKAWAWAQDGLEFSYDSIDIKTYIRCLSNASIRHAWKLKFYNTGHACLFAHAETH